MQCPKCNSELVENSIICKNCGYSFKNRKWKKYVYFGIPIIVILVTFLFLNNKLKLFENNQKIGDTIGKNYDNIRKKIIKDENDVTIAEIRDNNGLITKINDIHRYQKETCSGMIHYIGVDTEIEFKEDFIPLYTGSYIINIPFKIIDKIDVEEKKIRDMTNFCKYTVLLCDKTIIYGEISDCWIPIYLLSTFDKYIGTSEIGNFEIFANKVTNIKFIHKNQTLKLDLDPVVNNSLSLFLSNGNSLLVTSTRFVKKITNKNGCYTGKDYISDITIETEGGSKFNIPWQKIFSIEFIKEGGTHLYYFNDNIKVLLKNNSSYIGKVENEIIGIEGITSLGNYKLNILIPFQQLLIGTSAIKPVKLLFASQ
jgi:hypothetical protein